MNIKKLLNFPQDGEFFLALNSPIHYYGLSLENTSARYLEMAVPKRKTTPSKRNMRRAYDAIKSDAYVENPDTGELHRPHHIDLKTGMYRGRQVLKVKERY